MSQKPINPFAMFDFTRAFDAMKMPGFDMEAIMRRQRETMEAMLEVNRVAVDGYQALMTRQIEIMRETVDTLAGSVTDLMKHTQPGDAARNQIEVTQRSLDKAYNNLRELTEMAGEANSDTFRVFQERMGEQLRDLTAAASNAKPNGSGKSAS